MPTAVLWVGLAWGVFVSECDMRHCCIIKEPESRRHLPKYLRRNDRTRLVLYEDVQTTRNTSVSKTKPYQTAAPPLPPIPTLSHCAHYPASHMQDLGKFKAFVSWHVSLSNRDIWKASAHRHRYITGNTTAVQINEKQWNNPSRGGQKSQYMIISTNK